MVEMRVSINRVQPYVISYCLSIWLLFKLNQLLFIYLVIMMIFNYIDFYTHLLHIFWVHFFFLDQWENKTTTKHS